VEISSHFRPCYEIVVVDKVAADLPSPRGPIIRLMATVTRGERLVLIVIGVPDNDLMTSSLNFQSSLRFLDALLFQAVLLAWPWPAPGGPSKREVSYEKFRGATSAGASR